MHHALLICDCMLAVELDPHRMLVATNAVASVQSMGAAKLGMLPHLLEAGAFDPPKLIKIQRDFLQASWAFARLGVPRQRPASWPQCGPTSTSACPCPARPRC